MLSSDNTTFEIQENHLEFQEICSKLKDHAFPSPWKIFFKSSNEQEFTSEVSEFCIDDSLMKGKSNTPVSLLVDISTDVSIKNHSSDIRIDKKKVFRLKESLMSAQDDSTVDHAKDFNIFFTIPSSQIPELFQMLDILAINDMAINLLLNAFLHFKDQIGIATATALVQFVICPLVFEFKKNNSRFLLTTILKFAEAYPKAIIDEVLIPYSEKETSDDLESEVISQIAKTYLPNEYVSYSIKKVLEHALPVENSFTILQCLIERKVCHESVLYDLLLTKLLSWTSTCNKNVKFTKLLTSILFAHGNEFTDQQISLCDEVVKTNKTIIKRAAENLLKKLKNEKP